MGHHGGGSRGKGGWLGRLLGDFAGAQQGHSYSQSKPDLTSQSVSTISCQKCHTINDGSSKFCQQCGEAFPQGKFCSNCGVEMQAGAKFCSNCGGQF